jgi:flagellar biosynthesis protein FliR
MLIDRLMAFVLVLVRVAGVFAFLPIMGEGYAPQVVKALAAVVVSIVLVPVMALTLPVNAWDPVQFFLYVGAEALFGALMGVCALFIFKALIPASFSRPLVRDKTVS